jgi:hypothetical protein
MKDLNFVEINLKCCQAHEKMCLLFIIKFYIITHLQRMSSYYQKFIFRIIVLHLCDVNFLNLYQIPVIIHSILTLINPALALRTIYLKEKLSTSTHSCVSIRSRWVLLKGPRRRNLIFFGFK